MNKSKLISLQHVAFKDTGKRKVSENNDNKLHFVQKFSVKEEKHWKGRKKGGNGVRASERRTNQSKIQKITRNKSQWSDDVWGGDGVMRRLHQPSNNGGGGLARNLEESFITDDDSKRESESI